MYLYRSRGKKFFGSLLGRTNWWDLGRRLNLTKHMNNLLSCSKLLSQSILITPIASLVPQPFLKPNWLFQQVYTIHVCQHGAIIPAVFVLMNERSTNAYVRVLTELKNIRPDLNPFTFMTDFEQASLGLLAFRTIFKDVQQLGCLLHLSQCLWKCLRQTDNLQTK